MAIDPLLAFYAVPLMAIWTVYGLRRYRNEVRARSTRAQAVASGLGEPASLHPIFDRSRCIGCRACVNACPEGTIIGLINGKAELIEPSHCIGHGACKAACPAGAISLVFGTAERGVDIPQISPEFETNVPGIFIAGELGGMGLIRNAVEQGRQAVQAIARLDRVDDPNQLDLVIVGAGPAGIAASLAAKEIGLKYVTLEQDSFGGTIAHFPRGKLVMTKPARLPLAGAIPAGEVSKESLLSFFTRAAISHQLRINYQEHVQAVKPLAAGGIAVHTARGCYVARAVLLAIGRRGTPRKLDVPGEDQAKVVYKLDDPGQYRDQHVLVVGGGDSAIEAATSIAEEPGTKVAISYRGDGFSRAKPKNRSRLEKLQNQGRLDVLLNSQVTSIGADSVDLAQNGEVIRVANDAVIVCAGGILPTNFLKSIGIAVETKHGTA